MVLLLGVCTSGEQSTKGPLTAPLDGTELHWTHPDFCWGEGETVQAVSGHTVWSRSQVLRTGSVIVNLMFDFWCHRTSISTQFPFGSCCFYLATSQILESHPVLLCRTTKTMKSPLLQESSFQGQYSSLLKQASFPMESGFMLMTQSNQVTAACYHLISDTDLHQLSMCISAENKGGSWQPGGDFWACRETTGDYNIRNRRDTEQCDKVKRRWSKWGSFHCDFIGNWCTVSSSVPLSQNPLLLLELGAHVRAA